jgi:RNA polymerase sigma-70 factor, ECF subfamily
MTELRPPARAIDDFLSASNGSVEPVRRQNLVVERARSGDRAAFEAIVEHRLDATLRIALAILGTESDARDAVQDAFLKAWRELPRLREVDRFDAWFSRIVVNTCRSALRGRGRRTVREITLEASLSTMPSSSPGLEVQVSEIDALERAFERLGIAERTVLTLHYLEHRPLAEIGVALGVPQGTVKSRLYAARQAFARALEVTNR